MTVDCFGIILKLVKNFKITLISIIAVIRATAIGKGANVSIGFLMDPLSSHCRHGTMIVINTIPMNIARVF